MDSGLDNWQGKKLFHLGRTCGVVPMNDGQRMRQPSVSRLSDSAAKFKINGVPPKCKMLLKEKIGSKPELVLPEG